MSNKLYSSVDSFLKWKSSFGFLSYDRMDYWSSSTGILAKKLFYKNKLVGFPLAFWGLLLENFMPSVQKIYQRPHREVIGDAHFALGFMNLYELTNDRSYLVEAEKLLKDMIISSSHGYSGLSWGYTFGWQTPSGFWQPKIPLITITPYAFWAFKRHYELTDDKESLNVALSIASFAFNDLNEVLMPNGTFCSSYSPISNDIVINANSYKAAVLYDAYSLNGDLRYKASADRCIDFIISYQGNQGEWYYEAKSPQDNFIDNFHTCFVLRNLFYCYTVSKDSKILDSILRGYEFYRNELFHKNGRPKHFAKSKYFKLRKYEMYDYAEGIKLGVLLKDNIPEAFDKALFLADDLVTNFQTKKGHFITRVTSFGTQHTVPYLRWPQAQLFYALTLLLKELKDRCAE